MGTKTNKVKKILKEEGKLTSLEAVYRIHTTRLSAIIFNLREYGWEIDTVTKKTMDGSPYGEYILIRSGADGKQKNVQHKNC